MTRNGIIQAGWFTIALCDLAMMALAISINLLPVFLTTLSVDLGGLNEEQLGRIGAMTFVGLCIGILITGPAADRMGARSFGVGGNLMVAGGLTLLGVARTYEAVIAAVFVMGLGAGMLDMVLSPIVSAMQPRRRTIAMNLLHSFYCIGAVVTILVGSLALRYNVGWRSAAFGLIGLPVLIAVGFLLARVPALVEDEAGRMSLKALARQRYFFVACVAIFLGGATEMGMAYWLPAYAETTLGYSQWTAGMAFLAFSLAMAVGRIGIVLLPKSVGPVGLMLACCAGSVVLFPLASFAPARAVTLACCVLAGLAGSCLWPSTLAVAADRYPRGGASMFAILAALGNLGGICMPWIVGAVAERSSLRWGLATATLCPLLMIGCLLWMRRRDRAAGRGWAAPPPIAEP